MRQRTAKARIVTRDIIYLRASMLIDDTVATVQDPRTRVAIRTLVAVQVSVVDGGGRRRIAGTNEEGDAEVWTFDLQGCQSCGGGFKTMPTPPDEVPL